MIPRSNTIMCIGTPLPLPGKAKLGAIILLRELHHKANPLTLRVFGLPMGSTNKSSELQTNICSDSSGTRSTTVVMFKNKNIKGILGYSGIHWGYRQGI